MDYCGPKMATNPHSQPDPLLSCAINKSTRNNVNYKTKRAHYIKHINGVFAVNHVNDIDAFVHQKTIDHLPSVLRTKNLSNEHRVPFP